MTKLEYTFKTDTLFKMLFVKYPELLKRLVSALLEVTRRTPLTDKMSLHYFELPKLPEGVKADDWLWLWLSLFKAETEEDLKKIEILEVPIMKQAIDAYRSITATDEFKEIERLRSLARHNEASALGHARREERAKWQAVVAQKDTALAQKDAEIERLRAELGKTE